VFEDGFPGFSELRVEPLRISPRAFVERRIDEDFDELAVLHTLARHLSLGAEWRNEGNEHDQARVGHQPRHLGHAADVFDAVLVGKAQIPIEPMADVVTVKQIGVPAEARGRSTSTPKSAMT
jgi:hypothetical protein